MIHELLAEGEENARTAKELKDYLGLKKRQITKQIERERRAGWPICASVTDPRGYFLAESRETLAAYCHSLKHRHREVGKTLEALEAAIDSLPSMRD